MTRQSDLVLKKLQANREKGHVPKRRVPLERTSEEVRRIGTLVGFHLNPKDPTADPTPGATLAEDEYDPDMDRYGRRMFELADELDRMK